MIIVGAKGFAKEVLEILHQLNQLNNLVFYDDVNNDVSNKLFLKFSILKTINEAQLHFETIDNRFVMGIGNPILRKKLTEKFENIEGKSYSTISNFSRIGSYNVQIGDGCNILDGTIISNDVSIGKGCILYYNSVITHDCTIGDFVEISPSVTILGKCKIGSYSQIGANATILPNINIGENVVIGDRKSVV